MKLNVNKQIHDVDADPRTPLLYVLRGESEAQRGKIRLRARPVRRLHRAGGWRAGIFLRHADRAAGGQGRSRRWRDSARRRAGANSARLHRSAGCPVRLLHSRHDDARAGVAAEKSRPRAMPKSAPGSNPISAAAAPICAFCAPSIARSKRHADGTGRRSRMSDAPTVVSRRTVLAGSGALILSFSSSGELLAQDTAVAPAPPPRAAGVAGQPEANAVPRFLDPRRCRRFDHRLHRQSRTRTGH